MKVTIGLGFVIGFVATLAAAYLFPFVDHARIESRTGVAINGGRSETFLIRLPVDRIASLGDAGSALRGGRHPASLRVPRDFSDAETLVEQFKLRDIDGHVIGLATYHSTVTDAGSVGVWAIDVPGRGTIVFAGTRERPTAIDSALRSAGYVAGVNWTGDVNVDLVVAPDSTRVVTGAEEFENVEGGYEESWNVTGVSPTGEVRGTIQLSTLVQRRP
jgi:hypothetical protein